MASNFARFPLPFRLGTDICRIPRMRKLLSGHNAKSLIRRVLTEEERRAASALLEPYMSDNPPPTPVPQTATHVEEGGIRKVAPNTKVENFMAGRFAAKEAVMKASDDRLSWHDIEIRKKESGKPFAVIRSDAGWREALLSISHDGDYATATCIVAVEDAWLKESKQDGEKKEVKKAGSTWI
ncbi:4'-phosphopantetheinyl transferase superfamily [Coniochaeta sp. 2T2.1]|nr:4'-phosphopantetheinyl transferase superfamily [Coniochaeta sp. 2T2.1]